MEITQKEAMFLYGSMRIAEEAFVSSFDESDVLEYFALRDRLFLFIRPILREGVSDVDSCC